MTDRDRPPAPRCNAGPKRYHAFMQSSVAAIRGGRIHPRFVRPSSHHRVRRLGLLEVAAGRMVTAPRTPGVAHAVRAAQLRRAPRMVWTHPFATLRRGRVVDPAAPWRR